jgi:Arc/MetJ-type ribon-helix-helix transcriptional regulator
MTLSDNEKTNPNGVVYVKLPPDLIRRLDLQIQKGVFRSRSEGIRYAVSEYLDRLEDRQAGRLRTYVVPDEPETPRSYGHNKQHGP